VLGLETRWGAEESQSESDCSGTMLAPLMLKKAGKDGKKSQARAAPELCQEQVRRHQAVVGAEQEVSNWEAWDEFGWSKVKLVPV